MLRYLKWSEAADLIIKGVTNTIANKELTYDLARLREAIKAPKRELAARKNVEEDLQRLIPGATLMSCSGFATAIIRHMGATHASHGLTHEGQPGVVSGQTPAE